MDTSIEYINLCEKAKEIQVRSYVTARSANGLSFVLHTIRIWKDIYFTHEGDYCYVYPDGSLIVWLPRQDQLQAMSRYGLAELLLRFTIFCYGVTGLRIDPIPRPEIIQFKSMEQLWLAFLMHKKYHKKWLNGDWKEE